MFIIDFVCGILIGISNIMPGLSGASVAVALNVYDKLLDFFSNIIHKPVEALKKSLSLMIGVLVGIFIGLIGVVYLIQHFPVPTLCFMVGIIIGGIPKVYEEVKDKKIKLVDIVTFTIMIIIIIGLPLLQEGHAKVLNPSLASYFLLFVLGAIAASAMIIPGVSGSMLLLVLGYYIFIVNLLKDGLTSFIRFEWSNFLFNLKMLIPFLLGVVISLLFIAKLIKWLLKKYPRTVYYAILGLIIASPFAVIYSMFADPDIGARISESLVVSWIIGAVMLFAGAYLASFLGNIDNSKKIET